jgi:azurin
MMKRSWSVSVVMLVMLFLAYPLQEAEAAKRTIKIEGNDQMQYSVTEIQASPGDTLHITLTTVSNLPDAAFMSHNWVLLKKDANVQSFVNASITAESNGYVAPNKKDDILALTGLADKGETTEVTFVVPSEPGEYTYVCTFPGHYDAGMVGTLIVSG